ncbi:MAG: hypothetical protein P8X63_00510 [Desulfuromonadaceae bacterium]
MNKDNVMNVLLQTEDKHQRFLAAWKRGVEFLGADLFGPGTVESARDKNDLCPLRGPIEMVFKKESSGEEQFLAALVSFYDPLWGAQLAKGIGCPRSVCGLTYNLDHQCTQILCELLLNYEGW